MASNLDQFPELELSKEDREQIFEFIDPPVVVGETNRTQNGARYVDYFGLFYFFMIVVHLYKTQVEINFIC